MRVRFSASELRDLYNKGKFTELVARCLDIVRALQLHEGSEPAEVATALEDLGLSYDAIGEHGAAVDRLSEALRIEAVLFGEVSEPCFRTLLDLGRIYTSMHRLSDAELCFNRATSIIQHLPLDEQRGYSNLLINQSRLHVERQQYEAAERLLLEAARCRLRQYGRHHPMFGVVFDRLSILYWRMGKPHAAERSVRKAIRIYEDASQTENSTYAMMCAWLGRLNAERGALSDAREFYHRALEVLGRVRQPADSRISEVHQLLARLDSVGTVTSQMQHDPD